MERSLPAGDRLLLDASALIAYFDGGEPVSGVAACAIDEFVREGRNEAIVSMVTVMELLVGPLRRSPVGYKHVLDFIANFPNLQAVPIDLPIAQEAAGLRATLSFPAPDALTIATGLVHQVGHLVTNDGAWQTRLRRSGQRITVCHLGDHTPLA